MRYRGFLIGRADAAGIGSFHRGCNSIASDLFALQTCRRRPPAGIYEARRARACRDGRNKSNNGADNDRVRPARARANQLRCRPHHRTSTLSPRELKWARDILTYFLKGGRPGGSRGGALSEGAHQPRNGGNRFYPTLDFRDRYTSGDVLLTRFSQDRRSLFAIPGYPFESSHAPYSATNSGSSKDFGWS